MDQKVRWALIGCGDISERRVAPALRDLKNSTLVSVSRKRTELASAFAKRFGASRWFADWREQIRDAEIDAVYVATPVSEHKEQTIRSAEAGKHVLCEKPMAMTAAECREMIDACGQNGIRLGVAYYRHFYPVLARIREIIASGEIGKAAIAQMNAFSRHNPKGNEPRAWLLDRKQSGGGPMIDFGVHRIEVLLHLFGEVTEVLGTRDNLFYTDRDVEDTSIAILKFRQEIQAVLTTTHTALEEQDTLHIFGTEGSLHLPSLNRGELQVWRKEGERIESHPPQPNIHQPMIQDFADAVLTGRDPLVYGRIGLRVAEIVDAIYKTT